MAKDHATQCRGFPKLSSASRHAVVSAILIFHVGLLAWSDWRHSPTVDETAHLSAGIYYWQFARFDLYRVNPPLVRLVAALPVIAAGVKTDWSGLPAASGERREFLIGRAFVAVNGARSFWYFTIARWACAPFRRPPARTGSTR